MKTATNIKLSAAVNTADAFRVIGRDCLRQLLANQAGVVAGDGEALHQMRIALRRLRAAMSVFAEVVSDRDSRRIKAELRRISAALGPARDLDVFLSDVLIPLRRQHAREPGVAAICRDFEGRRKRAYEKATSAVRSRRFRGLALNARAWIEAGPWARGQDKSLRRRRERSIAIHAAEELARRRRKLRSKGRTVRQLSARKRHRLRIRVKKMRYATEFFADLFATKKQAKRLRKTLSALKDLQDALGALNDVATRESLVEFIVAHPRASPGTAQADEGDAVGVILRSQGRHVAQLPDAAGRAYSRFLEVKPFWK